MDQITTDLWISDAPSVRDLPDDHRFGTVLTLGHFYRLCYECPQASDTGDKFVFPDSPEHEYADFAAAVDYLRDRLTDPADCPVLVHCQAGVSRSGAVCATAIAVERGVSFADGYHVVTSVQDKVDPIPALRQSARRYISAREDGP